MNDLTITKKDSETHFTSMSNEEKRMFRWQKIINGQLVLALCLHPETPLLGHISFFVFENFKPVYIGKIFNEMWDDDMYLIHLINRHYTKEPGYDKSNGKALPK